METVKDLKQYYALVKRIKSEHGGIATNCFLFPDAVKRLIALGRFRFEEVDAGGFFYSDEENYYQAYYYLDSECGFSIEKKEKAVLIQNLYMEGKKKEKITQEEKQLEKAGFILQDRMKQITGDPNKILKNIAAPCRVANRFLSQKGFQVLPVSTDTLPEIRSLQKETSEIPYYQIPYFTDQEFEEEAAAGRVFGVFDKDGRLCAARQIYLEGKSLYGWLAVKEQYKELYGMALVLSEQTQHYAIDNGYSLFGWITETNQASIQYHMKLGYKWVGRVMDEWVLNNGSCVVQEASC